MTIHVNMLWLRGYCDSNSIQRCTAFIKNKTNSKRASIVIAIRKVAFLKRFWRVKCKTVKAWSWNWMAGPNVWLKTFKLMIKNKTKQKTIGEYTDSKHDQKQEYQFFTVFPGQYPSLRDRKHLSYWNSQQSCIYKFELPVCLHHREGAGGFRNLCFL